MTEIRIYETKDQLDDEIRYQLYQHLGRGNAIDRWDLVRAVFGKDAALALVDMHPQDMDESGDHNRFDRRIRDGIERLRNNGHMICNMGSGDGYYIAATIEEYQEFRLKYGRHAFPIIQTIRRMDETAKQKWPNPLQPSLL